MIDAALKTKLLQFQRIVTSMDFPRLYELLDLINEIQSLKDDSRYSALLSIYDTSTGVNTVIEKLPHRLVQKWSDRAARFKRMYNVPYPPLDELIKFLQEMCTQFNDPGLNNNDSRNAQSFNTYRPKPISVSKTDVDQSLPCLLHGNNHPLIACRTFQQKSIYERKKLLKENKVCYKCCNSNQHRFRQCKAAVCCKLCAGEHVTAMHVSNQTSLAKPDNGGEEKADTDLSSRCTAVCGEGFTGRSCAKTLLVKVYRDGQPESSTFTYAILDDQSNKILASPAMFNKLNINPDTCRQYTLRSCSGTSKITSRLATDIVVELLDGSCRFKIKNVIECELPDDKSEIATPEVAKHFSHLSCIAGHLPPIDAAAEIGLLVGRDVADAHIVQQQIVGPKKSPFAQKLPLGWVIVGEVCLGLTQRPNDIETFKTFLTTKGSRFTVFDPCDKKIDVTEFYSKEENLFYTSRDDEKVGLSRDDHEFLQIMDAGMKKDKEGRWKAPLLFKKERPRLDDNRAQALHRAQTLKKSLEKNPTKQKHMAEFMSQIFESKAAEVAPEVPPDKEKWYLPLFGVYHPRKPDKIWGVFDSSVEFRGKSLNKVLLTGPNLTNSMLGVLQRFRRDAVAIISDIQQMFYSFLVYEEHQDFLRFFWHADNDPTKDLVEYRMRVHVFGNTPSPAVATYGLRKSVEEAELDVRNFVTNDFYVDDGLTSRSSTSDAISLLKRTQETLESEGRIKLHKIAPNCTEVLEAFPTDDLEKNLGTIDFNAQVLDLPTQPSLGLTWDLNNDLFVFRLSSGNKPASKRGMLSTINSIFDPIGFLSPVVICGRIMLREFGDGMWDELLPEPLQTKWNAWKSSLATLEQFTIPRMFTATPLSEAT